VIAPTVPPQSSPFSDQGPGLFNKSWWLFLKDVAYGLSLALRISTSGTHAQRLNPRNPPASSFQQGAFYLESDRGVTYQNRMVMVGAANLPTWVYAFGEMAALLAAIPTDLGVNDAGFIFDVLDFNHRLQWSGTAWGWAPGDEGSGRMVVCEIDPTGAGWHLYDGSAGVLYLKATGATGTITLPNLVGVTTDAAFIVAGSPNGGPNAATAPTIGGSTATASAVTGLTNPAATGSTSPGNTGAPSATVTAASGSGITVATFAHTHIEAAHTHSIGAPADPGHVHTLTGITAGTDGTPANLVRRPWFRQ
jgi:hypothetical protein